MARTDFVRVRVIDTKTHISIPRSAFNSKLHAELKQDALDRNGRPRPPKYPTPTPGADADAPDTDSTEENQS